MLACMLCFTVLAFCTVLINDSLSLSIFLSLSIYLLSPPLSPSLSSLSVQDLTAIKHKDESRLEELRQRRGYLQLRLDQLK